MQTILLTFYTDHKKAFRVITHGLLWVVLYVLIGYNLAPSIFKDNATVVNLGALAIFSETVALYYLIGYWLFPRYLYAGRYGYFLAAVLGLFLVVYWINYASLHAMLPLSNSGRGGQETYVRRIDKLLREAGWLGCFTRLPVFLWNYGYGFFLATLTLVAKAIKDLIGYQRRLVVMERDKFALELSFLKAQVNPHFLFNTLNSVYARVFDTDEQAADLILRLSELMRYNLYETDLPRIALEKELAYLQNYLNLERNRLAQQYVTIDYQESGDARPYQIAPLLLIAFVENAFKHGVKGTRPGTYVQVRVTVGAGGRLVFAVENSVPPKRAVGESASKAGGIGLVNVRRRLEALYPGQYALVITPGEGQYAVNLTLQLEAQSEPGALRVGRTNG